MVVRIWSSCLVVAELAGISSFGLQAVLRNVVGDSWKCALGPITIRIANLLGYPSIKGVFARINHLKISV